jgi:hypothetical protein
MGRNIPYKTGKYKYDDMSIILKDWTIEDVFKFLDNLFKTNDTLNSMETIDTMIYLEEMLKGRSLSYL